MHEENISQLDFNYDNHRGNKVEERYGNGNNNYQNQGLYKNEAGGFTISDSGIQENSYLDRGNQILLQKESQGQLSLFEFNYNPSSAYRIDEWNENGQNFKNLRYQER